ncbi:hypothetical protein MTP99_001760 [Tenebrio molitor]|nr:hypothetical protein MTP99_001760 [Tenebrio molitor]
MRDDTETVYPWTGGVAVARLVNHDRAGIGQIKQHQSTNKCRSRLAHRNADSRRLGLSRPDSLPPCSSVEVSGRSRSGLAPGGCRFGQSHF